MMVFEHKIEIDQHFDGRVAVNCGTCKTMLINGPLPMDYSTVSTAVMHHIGGDLQDAVKGVIKEIPVGSLMKALLHFRKN